MNNISDHIKASINKSIFRLLLIPAWLFTSCTGEYFDFENLNAELTPEIAVPLVNSTMTFEDMISLDNSGLFVVDSDNFVTIVYEDTILSEALQNLVVIPDQDPEEAEFGLPLPPGIDSIYLSGTFTTPFISDVYSVDMPGGEELRKVVLKKGTMNASLEYDFRHDGEVIIKVPYAKKNGISLTKKINISYNGVSPVKTDVDFDLSGYELDLTNSGTTVNKLIIQYQIKLKNSGEPVYKGDRVKISSSFSSFEFSYLEGYLGNKKVNVDADTVELDITAAAITEGITFADPKAFITVHNSYGIPIEIGNFIQANTNSGIMTVTGFPDPFLFNTPTQPGSSAITEVVLSNSTSNLQQVFKASPEYLIYDLDAEFNPGGQTINFITDSSRFTVGVRVELPMHGTAKNLVLQDTSDFNLLGDEQEVEVTSVLFNVVTENDFPINGYIQIYFTDNEYQVLDSLMNNSDQVLASGILGTGERTIKPSAQVASITIPTERIDNLKKASKILIRGTIDTYQGGSVPVKIFSDYKLNVRLGAKANLKYSKNGG